VLQKDKVTHYVIERVCAFTYFVADSITAYVKFLICTVSFDFMCFIIILCAATA